MPSYISDTVKKEALNAANRLLGKFISDAARTALPQGPIMGQSINDLRNLGELQRSYNFEVILPDMAGYSGIEVSKFCCAARFGDYDMADAPTLRYGAHKASYAGFLDVGDVVMEFLVPMPDIVSEYLFAWRNLVVDGNGFYSPKERYARHAFIRYYSTDGRLNKSYKLKNLFPKQTPTLDMRYDSNEIAKLRIDFNVDRIEVI